MGIGGEGMTPSCHAGGSFNSRDAFQQNGHKSSKTTGISTHIGMKDLRKNCRGVCKWIRRASKH